MCGFGLRPKDQFPNHNCGAAGGEIKSAAFDSCTAVKVPFKCSN